MSREGIPIKKEDVKQIILNETENSEISLDQKEYELINGIVESFPTSPNTTHLLKWCNSKVSTELEKYPDMLEDISEIRNKVGKELRYKIDESRFEEVRSLIQKENPETINPQWIRDRFYGLSISIRRGYKNIDGSIDWDFISKKLGIEDRFTVAKTETWNHDKEKIFTSLHNVFEEKNPILISPNWICEYAHSEYQQLRKNFRDKDDHIDWDMITASFKKQWKERWQIQNRTNIEILSIVENIVRTCEEKKPTSISPSWISKNLNNDYKILQYRILKQPNKELNWDLLLDLLPIKWSKIWTRVKKTSEFIPDNKYEDSTEIESIIDKFKDKMYTFYVFREKRIDTKNREQITQEFRKLILKGNKTALDHITNHIYFTVEDWIENDPDLKPWKYATEELKETIKICLYRQDSQKGGFFTYLYSSLRMKTKMLQKKSKSYLIDKEYNDKRNE